MPVWMLMHRFMRLPDIRLVPAMAKMAKKNSKMTMVFPKMGIAWARAYTRTLRPLTEEMVLRGRMTLKALSPLSEKPESEESGFAFSNRAG